MPGCFAAFPYGRQPGNLAFNERQVGPANARNLARTIDSGNRGMLIFIDHDRRIANGAEQHRQLEIGHKAEAAGEDVARFGPNPPTALQRDGLNFRMP